MEPVSTLFLLTLGSALLLPNQDPFPWEIFLKREESRHTRLGIQVWQAERITWDRMQEQGLLPPGWNIDKNGRPFDWQARRITLEAIQRIPPDVVLNPDHEQLPSWARRGAAIPLTEVGAYTFEGFGPDQYISFVQAFIKDRLKSWLQIEGRWPVRIVAPMLENDFIDILSIGMLTTAERQRFMSLEQAVKIHALTGGRRPSDESAIYHLGKAMGVQTASLAELVDRRESYWRSRRNIFEKFEEDIQKMLPGLLEIAREEASLVRK